MFMEAFGATLLPALLTLHWAVAPGAPDCTGFRHLENGRTFFRYGGLYVSFSCNPGFRMFGRRTSSCVSGQWARRPPLCIAPGCPGPSTLPHGTSVMSPDKSLVQFSCSAGFRLSGSPLLYCDGRRWNGSTPVCEELDIMNMFQQKQTSRSPRLELTRNRTRTRTHLNTSLQSLLEALQPKPHMPGDLSERRPEHPDTPDSASPEPVGSEDTATRRSNVHTPTTFADPFNRPPRPATSRISPTVLPTAPLSDPLSAILVTSTVADRQGEQTNVPPPVTHTTPGAATRDLHLQHVTVARREHEAPRRFPLGLLDGELNKPDRQNTPSSQTPDYRRDRTTSAMSGFPVLQTGKRGPVCPYPAAAAAHGTLYVRTIPDPAPFQHKHYVEYACHAGYTLAHGDVYSHCLEDGRWSGVPPTCIDVNECVSPAAATRCVFGCVNTPGSFQCLCPAGYGIDAPHGHCRDIDECIPNAGLGPCANACVNTPGSFHCVCSSGYRLAGDGTGCVPECPPGYRADPPLGNSTSLHCVDVNECEAAEQMLRHKCEWKCVNFPGTHRCICPRGYTRHVNGYQCQDINECARGNGGCSHICMNHRGGYSCACPQNYRVSPHSRKKCQPLQTPEAAVFRP